MSDCHSITPVFPGPLSETLPPWRGLSAKKQLTTPDRDGQSNSPTKPTWSPQAASLSSQSSSATTATGKSAPPLDCSREVGRDCDETMMSAFPTNSQPAPSSSSSSSSKTTVSNADDGKDLGLNASFEVSSTVSTPAQVERKVTPAATARDSKSASLPATGVEDETQPTAADRGETTVPRNPSIESTSSVSLGGSKLGLERSRHRNATVGSSKKLREEKTPHRRGTSGRAASVGAQRKHQSLKSSRHGGYNRPQVPPGTSKVKASIKPREGNKGVRSSSKSVSPTVSGVPSALARRKPSEGGGDLEEGGTKSRKTGAETVGTFLPPAPASKIENTVRIRGKNDHGLVLPCAPSDEEKNYYIRSGRILLLTFGTLAFIFIFAGICLLTIVSVYFYWFALPGIFILVYFISYITVSFKSLGHDIGLDMHAEIVRKAAEQAYCPTVDIFLPVCKEPLVILENTWVHVSKLDYPNFTVYVLDDGGHDDVRELAKMFGFQYFRRDNRPEMKKAGNLRHAFSRTSGETYAILDADFCPRPDFLREMVPYLLDPSIGIVQSPQYFRWREEQTWTERGAGASQEFFYRLEQMNRDACGASVCVGSCGLYRRTAVEPFGGVAPIEHSEDMYTGFKMTELGYKIKYLPLILAMGICPDEPRSYFMQQYRWCKGTVSLVLEKDFWKSKLSFTQKLCFFNGMMYYVSTALFVFLAPLPVLLLVWIRAGDVLWFHTGFTVPSIIFTTMVIPFWTQAFKGAGMVQRMWRIIACFRVQIIQSYAHIYAIKDGALGISAPWAPSGGGANRSSSKAYDSSVWLLVIWNVSSTTLVAGGAVLRMTTLPWYHFVPAVALVLTNCLLSFSTLYYS